MPIPSEPGHMYVRTPTIPALRGGRAGKQLSEVRAAFVTLNSITPSLDLSVACVLISEKSRPKTVANCSTIGRARFIRPVRIMPTP